MARLLRSATGLLASLVLSSVTFALTPTPGTQPKVAAGTKLELLQPLQMEPGKAKVFIQGGKISSKIERKYEPYCYLASKRSKTEILDALTINPGSFTVTKKGFKRRDYSAALGAPALNVVSADVNLNSLIFLAMGDAGGFLFQNYYMYLQSDEHPSIHLLVCGVYGDPFERGPISSEEMRIAMGDVLIIDGLP